MKALQRAALLAAALFFCFGAAGALGEDEAGRLLEDALEAQTNERWELSIELLSRGAELYPRDYRFPWALGSLYYSRQLYGLAWEEYQKAEPFMPQDTEMLFRLSRTTGSLNMDAVSAAYLERVLELDPLNREAIDSLAWMYYKLHRLNEAAKILLDAVESLGPERDLCMTLGTVYADMFRYGESRDWYLRAIASAEQAGDMNFAAVAHYNLSILESRYYNYAEAFERANESLRAHSSPAGRLARGELRQRQLDLAGTFSDYHAAHETDTSPLSKLNLAQACQIAGRLEESRLYAESCLDSRDLSWMLNYGTDPDRYYRDLHEILYKTYGGLYRTESFKVYAGTAAALRGLFRKFYYRFREMYHGHLFKKYALLAARAYRAGGDSLFYGAAGLDAQIGYYTALESYPRRALPYLQRAREFEVPLIPLSAPAYDADEGILRGDPGLIRRSILLFDPLWERDMTARSLAELCRLLRGGRHRAERRGAAERLYAMNRGALRQNGIALPVEMVLTMEGPGGAGRRAEGRRAEGRLRRTLKRMGFEEAPAGARFRLSVTLSGSGARCELSDRERGTAALREIIPLPSFSRKELAHFAAYLENAAFTGF
ncbi:MAG: hypothetical protein LBQ35_03330 [Spirochaetaceae bacterium]|jgi:tetratricopeptide (TPR) repeat protein|nr:hypothetical protein [Spirochaetaceae bacterium]